MADNVIFIDFETYYTDKTARVKGEGYSIRNLGVAQYVNDPRFEIIMCNIRNASTNMTIVGHSRVVQALGKIDWANRVMVAHNARFEAYILHKIVGVQPKRVVCTLNLARAGGLSVVAGGSSSLANLVNHMITTGHTGFIPKGDEVYSADGKRLADFNPEELEAYKRYNAEDTANCKRLFELLLPTTKPIEILWQNDVVKMYSNPACRLDAEVLVSEKIRVNTLIDETLAGIGATRGDLHSSEKTANLFRALGIEPPMKPSTGKTKAGQLTYAFSKDDPGFVELLEHERADVQAIAHARVAVKGSGFLGRIDRMIELAKIDRFSVPLIPSSAFTGRLGGDELINAQNLPSGRKPGQTKALRQSICALPGYALIVGDLNAIEPRSVAHLANHTAWLDRFRQGKDPYTPLGAELYGATEDEILQGRKSSDPEEAKRYDFMRFVGKAGVLQAIYMAGGAGFYAYCQRNRINITRDQAHDIIAIFRERNKPIVNFWATVDSVLHVMLSGHSGRFGGTDGQLCQYDGAFDLLGTKTKIIRYADATPLVYHNLRIEKATKPDYNNPGKFRVQNSFAYDKIDNKSARIQREFTYSGKVTENINQCAGGQANKYAAARAGQFMHLLLNVHDEIVGTVPAELAPTTVDKLIHAMGQPLPYAPDLPIKGEAGWGYRYSDAK